MNTKSGHTQLPGRGVANVGPFARLSVKSTNECPETANFNKVTVSCLHKR